MPKYTLEVVADLLRDCYNAITALGTTDTDGSQVTQVVDAAGSNIDFATESGKITDIEANQTSGDQVTQVVDGSGGNVDFALETGGNLDDIKTNTDNIPSDPAKESGKLTTIDSTLTSIKNKTDNIPSDPAREGGKLTDIEANQTSGDQLVQIVNSSGVPVETHLDTDGEHYLGVAAIQAVHEDDGNSSTDNLTSANSYTFTGAGTSTLGVAALQWNLRTDQNATVYIEQSDDNTNWDISDAFDYYYSKGGDGGTVQAITSYWRIRVVLTGTTDTTYFRLKGILCPVADPLPRALNRYERLKTSGGIVDEETGTRVEVDSLGSLKTVTPVRLVGTVFDGTVKDTNFWTEVVTEGGSVTKAGEITLSTGELESSSGAGGGTAAYYSVRRARKIAGASNQLRAVAKLNTAPQADNVRRLGAYDSQDGFFFQVDGLTFGVGCRKGGADTIVTSGNFNGNYGTTVVMDTAIKRLVIEYDHLSTKFFVNGVLLHTVTGSTAALTNTLTLPVYMENNNSNGNDYDNSFTVRFACIVRLGELKTEGTYKYIGTNTTTICKYGAGDLIRILNVDNAGTVTIYDNTAASGTQIAIIDSVKALGTLDFEVGFSIGLTVVTETGAKVVVVYE